MVNTLSYFFNSFGQFFAVGQFKYVSKYLIVLLWSPAIFIQQIQTSVPIQYK